MICTKPAQKNSQNAPDSLKGPLQNFHSNLYQSIIQRQCTDNSLVAFTTLLELFNI